MKPLYSVLFALLLAGNPALASPVKEIDRACKTDQDCEVVQLRCSCMVCARATDLADGVVDAVNKQSTKLYANLAKCSSAETRRCATAGACAMVGKSTPVCEREKCTVQFTPITR